MARAQVVIDTDILSAILRQNPLVIPTARAYLFEHGQFTFSLITRFEILGGLKTKGAMKQIAAFERFCEQNTTLPLTDEVVVKAADIYADLSKRGELIGDADILIAATALIHGSAVVTNNEPHFRRVPQLIVENWLKQ